MNKYEIISLIDEGAYGIVWKAINKQNKQIVAIKQFKQDDQDELIKKNIQKQIKMLKMLKSQFVVSIKQAFKKKGKIYIIFQYFQSNLLNLIERYQNGLQNKLINQIIYKIIRCLKFLHSKNIIHRDIKPQNLLLNSNYQKLKICDFGFARFQPQNYYDLTEYVATRWYRSPQLLLGQPYGKPADIWALGCIIGQLVDGKPMYPGQNEIEQLFLIRNSIGSLSNQQLQFISNNPKFTNITIPDIKISELIDSRYLGKIEKNALKFMKLCLKVDPNERITIQQAIKHPYILQYSIEDNQFANDEQNLLHTNRIGLQTLNNNNNYDHKTIISSQLQYERLTLRKKIPIIENNNLLKLKESSLPEKEIYKEQNNKEEKGLIGYAKKNSEIALHKGVNNEIKKIKNKKMFKMMSEEKNLNVNLDVNLNINVKVHRKNKQSKETVVLKNNSRSKLPQINKNITKYHLNTKYLIDKQSKIHHKIGSNLSIFGESKELIKIKKPIFL